MSEAEHIAEVRRWLRYAREDLIAAESLVQQARAVWQSVCRDLASHGFTIEDAV